MTKHNQNNNFESNKKEEASQMSDINSLNFSFLP
jgi:hypothetical protein